MDHREIEEKHFKSQKLLPDAGSEHDSLENQKK